MGLDEKSVYFVRLNSCKHSFANRINIPMNISSLSELLVLANIAPGKSMNILEITLYASSIEGILKRIQVKLTSVNVIRILPAIKKKFLEVLLCKFRCFSMICRKPCSAPQIMKVQFAPCQMPLTKKVTIIFQYVRNFEHLLPPNGI